jgi:hypothetical protein
VSFISIIGTSGITGKSPLSAFKEKNNRQGTNSMKGKYEILMNLQVQTVQRELKL